MFYVKCGRRVRRTLRNDNIFTRCPGCGKEQVIDLWEVFRAGGDLYTTVILCETCASKRAAAEETS